MKPINSKFEIDHKARENVPLNLSVGGKGIMQVLAIVSIWD